jgi:alkylmercury lyase
VNTFSRLAGALVDAFPQMDERDQRLALTLLRTLANGEPVSDVQLADAANEPEDFVEAALARWAGVFYDDQQRVIGFIGLAIRPTSHAFLLNERGLWAWCAWDTLFLPELIGREARVSSTCPVTGEPVTLTVGPDGVRELNPPDAVVSFLVPDQPFDANILQEFCHFVHFFSSPQAGARWTHAHDDTFLMSVEDAYKLGRQTNRSEFSDALSRDSAQEVVDVPTL